MTELTACELKDQQGSCTIIDVREPGEYRRDHIPGSINIPLSELKARLNELEGKSAIAICCESGVRAKKALAEVPDDFVGELKILTGGMQAWRKESYPLNVDSSAPISMQRQVQIVAGSMVAIGTVLGVTVSPWFLVIPGFVGCGLVFAGITNTCGLAMMLSKLPYNRVSCKST